MEHGQSNPQKIEPGDFVPFHAFTAVLTRGSTN
jgi:hypothetical protein